MGSEYESPKRTLSSAKIDYISLACEAIGIPVAPFVRKNSTTLIYRENINAESSSP